MTYEELIARAAADPHVVGAVLSGSRGRGPFARDDSDWDVRLVFADDTPVEHARSFATPHGSPVEVATMSLAQFGADATDTELAWDRYSYVHATLALDKLEGRIAELLAARQTLPTAVAPRIAAAALDDYINSYFRALKNAGLGLELESHLDAGESISPLLTTIFAIHGRVRPFNKFLAWELREHPLPGDEWSADRLLPRLSAILATGAIDEQAALFRDVERLAREHGHGVVVDGWEPDVPRLRSGRRT
ncbi:MAG: hypothetical protein ACJ77B_09670 [Chloroflexota bacterium]